jgi:hypothetical protein
MIYLKTFLVGIAMFILGFALVLALIFRQAAVPQRPRQPCQQMPKWVSICDQRG